MSYAIREQRVKLVQDRKVVYMPHESLDSSSAAAACASKVLGSEPRENFLVFALSASGRITGMFRAATGGLSQLQLEARTIIQYALSANARAIIIAHNHPSGDPTPSSADKTTTASLKAACETVGIAILDHVIVTPFGGQIYSFADRGLL